MIVHFISDGMLVLSVVPTDPAWRRVCDALDVADIDLVTCFVTFARTPLTEEELHAKIHNSQHELRDAASQDELPF